VKAIPLLLVACVSLMRAEKLEPVSSIDFARSLHVKENSKRISIWMLSASPAGPMVAGGAASLMTSRIARSDRTGSGIVAFDLQVHYGGGATIAPLEDGSFWFVTRWTGSDFPPPPGTRGIIDTTTLPRGTTHQGPFNYDLYTRDGRYLKSFRILADSFAGLHPPDSPVNLAASAEEIALVYTDLIRAGHLAGGDFVMDREWRVNGPHLVFPFGRRDFIAINRFSGEFAILDPGTPDTRTVATPFKSPNRRNRIPVTAANGGIWFLIPGASPETRDLVQFAPDGAVVSRNTLHFEKAIKPLRIAISGRDVYVAGITATVYRYELPQ
jgi:hypothetical protein